MNGKALSNQSLEPHHQTATTSFVKATTDPRAFQATYQRIKGRSITLGTYAVVFLSIND